MQSPRVQISKLTFSNPKCNLCIQKVLDSCISKYFHAGLILDEKYIVYEKSVSDYFIGIFLLYGPFDIYGFQFYIIQC